MVEDDKNDKNNNSKKFGEKYTLEVNRLIIHSKASSINAKVNGVFPESFLVAIMLTGEHEVNLALLNQKINLENLLNKFRAALKLKQTANMEEKFYYDGLAISKSVWDAIREADKISVKQNCSYIGIEHIFMGFLKTFPPLKEILLEEGVNINEIVEDLKIGKFKKQETKQKKVKQQEPPNILNSLCTNITQLAKENKLDPIIARDEEIEEAITILCRRNKRNPMLVGEPGIGKTAIVDGIAQRIVSNTVPDKLKGCSIYNLNISDMVAGTKYRGEFESKIKDVLKEIEKDPSIILFIDEIHTIVGAGAANGGSLDAANIFKPVLARGMRCIGATTRKEYKKHIMGDGALERRFEKLNVDEPNEEQTIQILNGIKYKLEEYHNCTISSEAIEAAVRLSARYLTSNFFPDKAIDCIDTACAKYAWKDKTDKSIPVLKEEDVISVIGKKAKIPNEIMTLDNKDRINLMEKSLKSIVIGQDRAVDAIIGTIRKSYSGITNKNRPIGIFVFGGQTGTGKTYISQQIAKLLFARNESFIQLDMSEYSEKHTISRILGSPPSYVGYDDADTELEKIKRNPYCLVLLDEIEKADPQVMKIFLQVMREGIITDASGEKVNCKNIILVMTGNFGMNESKTSSIGFDSNKTKTNYEIEQNRLIMACKSRFEGEFVNRVDEFIPFLPLNNEDLIKIINMHLNALSERMPHKNYKLTFSDNVVNELILMKEKEHGQNAMMIDRLISKYIEPVLSNVILENENVNKFKVNILVDVEEGKFVAKTKKIAIKKASDE